MDRLFTVAVVLVVGIWVGVILIGTFEYNLPDWCAHPARPGNHLIQPFCH